MKGRKEVRGRGRVLDGCAITGGGEVRKVRTNNRRRMEKKKFDVNSEKVLKPGKLINTFRHKIEELAARLNYYGILTSEISEACRTRRCSYHF